jgi:hypothetical protein
MAINFPNNPIQGNTYEYARVRYSYEDTGSGNGFWRTITAASGPATSAELDAGTDTEKYATSQSLQGSKYSNLGSSAERDIGTGSDQIPLNSMLPISSSTVTGLVKLINSVSSTSVSLAATANAAKSAYDRGSSGISKADTAQDKANTCAVKSNNLSDLTNKTTARSNLSVLKSGTAGTEVRNNAELDDRFVIGDQGTGGGDFRTNTQNDARFTQYSASASEVNAGTNGSKYVTPSSLKGSKYESALSFLVPSGLITMWSGSTSNIPAGWVLCNGSNGTPNLRDRFVVGAGGRWNPGNTGGQANASVISHNHSASSGSAGSHYHTATTSTTGNHAHTATTSTAGNHTHSGNTSSAGNHNHTQIYAVGENYNTNQNVEMRQSDEHRNGRIISTNTGNAGNHTHSYTTNTTGNHTHTLTTNTTGNHNHTLTTNTVGNHSHSVSVNSNGVSATDKNLPPYYALAYIMKT